MAVDPLVSDTDLEDQALDPIPKTWQRRRYQQINSGGAIRCCVADVDESTKMQSFENSREAAGVRRRAWRRA